MEGNKVFYIKYQNYEPVEVETHYHPDGKGRNRVITSVGSLIAACATEPTRRLLGLPEEFGPLALHSSENEPAIAGNTPFNSIQSSHDAPLVLLFQPGPIVEQGSSTMLEIENIKTEHKKLQETVSNYIQKAETVQISKLTVDKLRKDGFTIIATSVDSINESDYQISDIFNKFEWPVETNEKDKRNKDAYLKYLTAFTESFEYLQVKNSIESPHLNTVVGIEPHHLNGEADLYVMPKSCRLICRNQLSMVFEMKPNDITANNLAQAIGYVIAANSLFDVPGRPSPVGVLTDFIDQWYLIWIGKEGEVFYAGMEHDLVLKEKPLTRLTALYYVQKHLENYNQLLKDEKSKKRRAEDVGWAFDRFEAGSLKKQKVLVAEDNMRDLLETDEEIAIYDMNKRLRATPLFQIP